MGSTLSLALIENLGQGYLVVEDRLASKDTLPYQDSDLWSTGPICNALRLFKESIPVPRNAWVSIAITLRQIASIPKT
jgi:hypothetical protein